MVFNYNRHVCCTMSCVCTVRGVGTGEVTVEVPFLDSSYSLRRKDRGDGVVRVCEDAV